MEIKELIEIMKKTNTKTKNDLIVDINKVDCLLSRLIKDYNSNTEVMALVQEIRDITNKIITGDRIDDVDKYFIECIVNRLETIEELMEQDNYMNCATSDYGFVQDTMRIINAIKDYMGSHNSTDAINAYYKEHGTYKGLDEYLKTIE